MVSARKGQKRKAKGPYCKNRGEREDRGGRGFKGGIEGHTLNGFSRRTGERSRRYTCNSKYHAAPQCPQKENRSEGPSPYQRGPKGPSNRPFPSIAMKSLPKYNRWVPVGEATPMNVVNSPPQRPWKWGANLCVCDDSEVVLDAGATTNLVRFKWLGHHNSRLLQMWIPRVSSYPAMARP